MDDDLLSDGTEAPDDKPESAKAWLETLNESARAFKDYQDKADNIDKLYASLRDLAEVSRDRQFQLFWANVQVLAPSIYSRPPIPVVVPRFKDRKPLIRITSELLERTAIVTFEMEDIDATMRQLRDDLAITARGVAWIRYEAKDAGKYLREQCCIEYIDRKDFLHDPARTWQEVDWVARASYLTKDAMEDRFKATSGDEYLKAAYEDRKDDETDDRKLKAVVWEIWCKSQNLVVWVSEGCEVLLDSGEPHLKLEGFFPCPRPAYGTTQRRSLIPVPDMLFYKDQLEEINELTARIGSLSDAVKVRGFYPAGAGEVGDAIEAAIKETVDNAVLIPVSNWAMLGGGAPKDMVLWLPIDMIVLTIKELVELRKQLIDDVYQITGLSDIMRGSTDADETLGAQELKSQYGSVRVKDRQNELVRIARDITRICAEIMAENFQAKTLLEMSQLDIPTDAAIKQQVGQLMMQGQQIMAQMQQAAQNPQMMQQAQQNPEEAQKLAAQAQEQIKSIDQQIEKLNAKPTIEKVMKFLRDERLRPYTLEIETDSTIAPDENAQKQRATEFMTAMGGYLNQVVPMLQAMPKAAPIVAEGLKFVASQYRAGRELEGKIEEFADNMAQQAANPQPSPEQEAAQADMKMKEAELKQKSQDSQLKAQIEQQKAQADMQAKEMEGQIKQQEAQAKMQQIMATIERDQKKHEMELQKMQMEMQMMQQEIGFKREAAQIDQQSKIQQANIQAQSAQQQAEIKTESAEQDAAIKASQAEQQAEHNDAAFSQKSRLASQQAAIKQQQASKPA